MSASPTRILEAIKHNEFSLLFHPDIDASMKDRIDRFEQLVAAHDPACPLRTRPARDAIKMLLVAKQRDCQSWPDGLDKERLLEGYRLLQAELGQD